MAATTPPATAWPHQSFLLWGALAVAWFFTMSWRPLLEPDEGRYAEIPREMSVTGDWVTPRLNGLKYFEKPALQYWATAVAYSVFGISAGASRFWSCALAFLCLPLVYYFAQSLYGNRADGLAAMLALALNPYFAIIGQLNLLDSGLAFFLNAALFAYLQARNSSGASERRWMLVASVALALATLSKGIVALVLTGGTVLIHLLVTRDLRPLRAWHLPLTLPVYLAITAPWFIVVSLRNPEFPEFFFVHEHFARYLTNVSDRVQPFWYFLPLLLLAVLPWLPQTVRACSRLWGADRRDPASSAQWLLAIWCVLALVFFSISHSKLATYILPIMPALAVLLAPQIAQRMATVQRAAWVCSGFAALVAAAIAYVSILKSATIPEDVVIWAVIAVVLATVGAAATRFHAVVPALTTLVAFQALIVSYSYVSPLRTAKPLLASVRASIGPHTQLFSVDQYRQSIPPYLGRTMRLVIYKGELEFGAAQDPQQFVPTLEQFEREWRCAHDAVAFIDPPLLEKLIADGLPFREISRDERSIAIARMPAGDVDRVILQR